MAIDAAHQRKQAPARPSRRPSLTSAGLDLLVASLAGGALAVGLASRGFSLVTASSVLGVDALVEIAVCGVGALVATWLAASALLALGCLGARLVGSSWRLGERMVHRCAPAVVRRTLVLAVGATVGLGAATGASAAVHPAPTPSVAAVTVADDDLGWVATTPLVKETASPTAAPVETADPSPVLRTPPSTPAAVTPVAEAMAAPAEPAATLAAAADQSVVVVAGDSLWAIAARHLDPHATDAQIAAAWPAWYHANAATIGPDPGVIVPGQVLAAPQDGATP
ncbi:LysM peptidoglycan-binding domain-containing protein [Cellulomonas sp. McL0617]|uniref:LysM peptidoglycan-binding domain-containing protein n=1 Tax=Cellulomonas sp. McL0617 TaxID=3415675 RepID=UPI003CF0CC66